MRVNIKPYPEFQSFIPYGTLGTLNYNEDGTVDFSVQTEEGTWNDFRAYNDEIEIKGDDLYLYMGGKIRNQGDSLSDDELLYIEHDTLAIRDALQGGKDNANS